MTDRHYVKLNSTIWTGSNADQLKTDDRGNVEAVVELELPNAILSESGVMSDSTTIELQTSKLRASLENTPICELPFGGVNQYGGVYSSCSLDIWPFELTDRKGIRPTNAFPASSPTRQDWPFFHYDEYNNKIDEPLRLYVPTNLENFDLQEIRQDDAIYLTNIGSIEQTLASALNTAFINHFTSFTIYPPPQPDNAATPEITYLSAFPRCKVSISDAGFSITYNTAMFYSNARENQTVPVLWGTPGSASDDISLQYDYTFADDAANNMLALLKDDIGQRKAPLLYSADASGGIGDPLGYGETFNIVGNRDMKDTFSFLPWIRAPATQDKPNGMGDEFYILDCSEMKTTIGEFKYTTIEGGTSADPTGFYSCDITYTWSNVAAVVMSPVTAIVLTIEGMGLDTQIYPINKTTVGGSSIITTVPIIENFYPITNSLASLHDELVVTREQFETTPTYGLDLNARRERTIRFRAQYITKSGHMKQLYIPPSGTYAIQVTFGIYY